MKTLQIANFFLLMLSLAACGPAAAPPGLSLEDGWVRAMAPGMTMTAAYGRFVNNGPERIEIREFGSDSFEDVSLHETTIEGGVSKMQRLPGLIQEPGTGTVLAPGGLHLMLMRPLREIRPGDEVSLTLTATNGERFRFTLPVRAR